MLLQEASFGCLMLYLTATPSDEIIRWGQENIDVDSLAEDGYEKEPHVTLLYGFHADVQPQEIEAITSGFGPVSIELGAITRFEQDEQDVIKIDVEGGNLFELNALLQEKFKGRFTNNYPDYHPHLTLAYVKKGAHTELNDDPTFFGRSFEFDLAVYSTANATQRFLIDLAGKHVRL